jgi:putative tricarboxylic transport membrane protein
MGRSDLYSSAFWFVFAIYIAVESCRLGLGKWDDPGAGYFPFGAALLFGVMALAVLVKSLKRSSEAGVDSGKKEKLRWQNVIFILMAMILYTSLLNKMGFVLCTFLIVIFFVKVIASQHWAKAILTASSMAIGSHLLFNVLLNAQLPKGFFFF